MLWHGLVRMEVGMLRSSLPAMQGFMDSSRPCAASQWAAMRACCWRTHLSPLVSQRTAQSNLCKVEMPSQRHWTQARLHKLLWQLESMQLLMHCASEPAFCAVGVKLHMAASVG